MGNLMSVCDNGLSARCTAATVSGTDEIGLGGRLGPHLKQHAERQ